MAKVRGLVLDEQCEPPRSALVWGARSPRPLPPPTTTDLASELGLLRLLVQWDFLCMVAGKPVVGALDREQRQGCARVGSGGKGTEDRIRAASEEAAAAAAAATAAAAKISMASATSLTPKSPRPGLVRGSALWRLHSVHRLADGDSPLTLLPSIGRSPALVLGTARGPAGGAILPALRCASAGVDGTPRRLERWTSLCVGDWRGSGQTRRCFVYVMRLCCTQRAGSGLVGVLPKYSAATRRSVFQHPGCCSNTQQSTQHGRRPARPGRARQQPAPL